ncbi:uncharacterized protein LOC131321723 [Rhododendron vialii]|uniref:uncharacterized protein LOC131321723 n=1 Tax=Rhododendron vialii TaxID=182163 RepID=UPI00265E30CD|nr:uncharacterized protein LOC131321723 [Rhododendron vialii]
MTTSSSPSLSLPHQDPEFPHSQNPNFQQQTETQSQPQSPQTLTLDFPNPQDQEAQEEDPIIVDHKGEEEPNKSSMSKSGISSSLSPPRLIIPPNTDQEPNPRSLASPTSLSRRPSKKKKGWPKKQKAIEKKVQTLIENLKPIPFKPSKTLNFGKHEKLLKRLGLWDFVHIEFDREVRVDLIAQLIANYESRSSYVNGLRVAVNRADLGRAFKLPVKKEKGGGSVSSEAVDLDSEAVVTEESIGFVEDFVSNWLLLHEDTWILPNEVVNWTKAVKDGHPEKVDWAGLIWFMVEKELNQGNKLKECYYASHLQHLIRSQREELFREENREEVGVEVKDEDDGGDVEMWQESKGEAEVEVKEEDDGGEVKMGQESKVETMVEAKKEEVDGEIKMGEEPAVEARVELKEEEEDSGEVKMEKEPTMELGVDVKEEDGGGKVMMEQQPMVDVGVDVKDDEDGGDVKIGKEPMMEAGVDVKEEVNLGEEPLVESGVNVKEEVEFGEEPMVEAVEEVKEEEDGGGEMKMGGFDDFQGQQLEDNVMGEELNVELTLGKEIAEMEEQDTDVKEGDMMDVEDSEADEQEQGQWLLDGKNSAGDHFLQRCNIDASTCMDGDEERKPEEEEEEEEEEVDDEEEEEAEDDHFSLLSRGNTLEGNMLTGNLLQGMETTQMPFSLTDTHGTSGGSSIFGHGSFGHGSKREIVHEDDISHKRIRSDGPWSHKSSDFEMCMEEMQNWMGKARMVYQEKENAFEVSNTSQQLLLGEIQRRDDLIEHLQKTKREEIQKKDGEIYRLERELYLMGNLLDGYRKAVKETQKAFFEYRQQCQLLEEPVYKDVGPGGLVLSTMELEKRRQKREEEEKMVRMVLEQKVKEFEENVFGNIEEKMEAHFNDVLKLNKRLMDAENEFKLLKELSAKPKVPVTSESAPVETTPTSDVVDM